jgi:hypothetical protein
VSEENPSAAEASSAPTGATDEAPKVPTQSTDEPPAEALGSSPVPAPAPVETIGSAPKHAAAVGADSEAEVEGSGVATAVKPRRRSGLLFTIVVLLVIVVAAGGYYLFALKNSPSRANIGDCLSGTEDPTQVGNIKLVSCGDSSATFKVTQKIANQPKTANDTACAGTDHDDVYWFGRNENSGTVLCLLKLKN